MEAINLNIPSAKDTMTDNDFNFLNSPQLPTNSPVNQTGGFLNNLFSNSSNKATLKAASDGRFDIVDYLIKNNYFTDVTAQDDLGNTILHYIAYYFDKVSIDTLNTILNNGNIKSAINIQNNNKGDTPAMVALKQGHDKFVDIMYNLDANFAIKNNDGLNIETETVDVSNETSFNNPISNINKILNTIVGKSLKSDTIDAQTLSTPKKSVNLVALNIDTVKPMDTEGIMEEFMDTATNNNENNNNENNTDEFLDNLIKNENNQSSVNTDSFLEQLEKNITNNQSGGSINNNIGTEAYLNNLLSKYDIESIGNNGNNGNNDINTEDYVQNVIDRYENSMTGGGSCGSDDLTGGSCSCENNLYGGGSCGSDDYLYLSSDYSEMYGGRETKLGEMIKRQNRNVHKEVVEKIQKILDISEDAAKIYKTLLWDHIKKEFPKLSNMDQTIEMDKLVTEVKGSRTSAQIKKFLKTFEKKFGEGEKIREKHKKEAEKRMKDKKSKSKPKDKKAKDKKEKDEKIEEPTPESSYNLQNTSSSNIPEALSVTSSEEVDINANYSDTSYSDIDYNANGIKFSPTSYSENDIFQNVDSENFY